MRSTPTLSHTNGRRKSVYGSTPPPVGQLIDEWLESSLLLAEDWEALAAEQRAPILESAGLEQLLERLLEGRLLTDYQVGRIESGTAFGLMLGNYRVLDRLGAGGMGVVFRAEHARMRKQVAVKVLPFSAEHDPRLLRRFITEMRTVARLQHPNIVGAIDAGEIEPPEGQGQTLHFFVMEYVPGVDLEEYVRSNGPLSPSKACDLIYQIASALVEAHKHQLVHRDIKPSNIQITPEGQAKLLDFGLARTFATGVTEPGTLLGTLDYMAPEQVQDAHSVDIRADLYALGGVLYWCLTGCTPFMSRGNLVRDLAARMEQPPPSVHAKRGDVSAELDQVVARMMAVDRDQRYASPEAVMKALFNFLKPDMSEHLLASHRSMHDGQGISPGALAAGRGMHRILVVDDDTAIRSFCRLVLQTEGLQCDEVNGGEPALEAVRRRNYDLVILDINMPDMEGPEVLKRLREDPPGPNLKVIMASGTPNTDLMAQLLLAGADDFVSKPFSVLQLQARVKAALRLKEAQDRTDLLHQHLLTANHELEQSLNARDGDLLESRNALVLALAKLVEQRAAESGAHLIRLQRYARVLAEEASRTPGFASQVDETFVDLLVCCTPLHDIGKVGLPDHILLKPGKLDADERVQMQAHTLIGAETLTEVAKNHPSSAAFLQMAIDIARHHHERFDGAGYPDRLQGPNIPLAARIVGICDVYDALRCRRVYKPALSHAAALQIVLEGSGQQFDPQLMRVFQYCAAQFERIYRENPE